MLLMGFKKKTRQPHIIRSKKGVEYLSHLRYSYADERVSVEDLVTDALAEQFDSTRLGEIMESLLHAHEVTAKQGLESVEGGIHGIELGTAQEDLVAILRCVENVRNAVRAKQTVRAVVAALELGSAAQRVEYSHNEWAILARERQVDRGRNEGGGSSPYEHLHPAWRRQWGELNAENRKKYGEDMELSDAAERIAKAEGHQERQRTIGRYLKSLKNS